MTTPKKLAEQIRNQVLNSSQYRSANMSAKTAAAMHAVEQMISKMPDENLLQVLQMCMTEIEERGLYKEA